MLTLIDYEIMPMFGIVSLRDRVHVDIDSYEIAYVLTLIVKRCLTDQHDLQEGFSFTWIDTGLRDSYRVGHLVHLLLYSFPSLLYN